MTELRKLAKCKKTLNHSFQKLVISEMRTLILIALVYNSWLIKNKNRNNVLIKQK